MVLGLKRKVSCSLTIVIWTRPSKALAKVKGGFEPAETRPYDDDIRNVRLVHGSLGVASVLPLGNDAMDGPGCRGGL